MTDKITLAVLPGAITGLDKQSLGKKSRLDEMSFHPIGESQKGENQEFNFGLSPGGGF